MEACGPQINNSIYYRLSRALCDCSSVFSRNTNSLLGIRKSSRIYRSEIILLKYAFIKFSVVGLNGSSPHFDKTNACRMDLLRNYKRRIFI